MESPRRERRENWGQGKLMSSNDRARNWRLRGRRAQATDEGSKREPEPSFTKKILGSSAHRKRNEGERTKLQKPSCHRMEMQTYSKAKTARNSSPMDTRPETRRFRKPSDRMRRKESPTFTWQENGVFDKKNFPEYNNIWDHANYSAVPTTNAGKMRDIGWKERKLKKLERSRRHKRSASDQRPEKEKQKEMGRHKKKSQAEDFVVDCLARDKEKQKTRGPGGKAVVIYQRQNRSNYLEPHGTEGYQFEQIAFSGCCEAAIDVMQSKRSLSEPRKKSLREVFVARRRTRFHMDPQKVASSTQSDFHSAVNILTQGRAGIKKFEGVRNGCEETGRVNPENECEKCESQKILCERRQDVPRRSKSSSDYTANVVKRLQQTAEKKLDLHRELMRAEKVHKKKFWESIQKSLNHRCTLPDMFSSGSILSQNGPSKIFSSSESSPGRGGGIYVRESVIQKISSYQGFHALVTPSRGHMRSTTDGKTVNSSNASTYRKMKTVLGSILINEDDEDEALEKEDLNEFSLQSVSGSTIHPEDTLYETNASVPPPTTSEKMTPFESSFVSGPETASDLELLMAKLSDEIKKCSLFIKKLNIPERDKLSVKFSMSDSKIELEREEREKNRKKSGKREDYLMYPVSLYSAAYTSSLDSEGARRESEIAKKPSDTELKSYHMSSRSQKPKSSGSIPRNTLASSPSAEKGQKAKDGEFPCCDDCKYLKKRIVKLEKELERIDKKMPFYPVKQQDSIKTCLERLKTASETVLKRLRSCARMRNQEHKQSEKSKKDGDGNHKRSSSAPEPALKECNEGKLILRSNNSDFKLNVGMELTMENVDPKTGEKLHPEVSDNTEQEGNIQCKVYRNGEDPLLIVDTDFAYNPKSGMLFKKKKKNPQCVSQSMVKVHQTYETTDLGKGEESKPSIKTYCLKPVDRRDPFEAKEKAPKVTYSGVVCQVAEANEIQLPKERSPAEPRKKSKDSVKGERREEESEERKSRLGNKERGSNKSLVEEVPERGVLKKSRISWGRNQSRIPMRKKPLPSSSKSRADSLSQKSSAASFSKSETSSIQEPINLFSGSGSKVSIKSSTKSAKSSQGLQKVLFRRKEKLCRMDKSTQTYGKRKPEEEEERRKTVDRGIQAKLPTKHLGVQVAAPTLAFGVDTDPPNLGFLPANASSQTEFPCIRPTVNVAVQADAFRKFLPRVHIGLQTNLPTEDDVKYLNDLNIQKKVNMAIAELCFHLTKAKEQQEK